MINCSLVLDSELPCHPNALSQRLSPQRIAFVAIHGAQGPDASWCRLLPVTTKTLPIPILPENIRPPIAPASYIIKCPYVFNPKGPGHTQPFYLNHISQEI